MQQEQPQFYASLVSHLSAEEQTVIQNVYQSAEAALVMAQQQQAAAAAAAAVPGGANGTTG
jgi:hemerythrin superfamily protein